MRVIIQRVKRSSVSVEGQIVGQIEKGLNLLVGIGHEDSYDDAEYCARKIVNMRIFEDEDQKMNLSLIDVKGDILSISQFTLLADTKKGNRPSFIQAANPDKAKKLFEYFNDLLKNNHIKVATGIFGADMDVSILNDGPVTIILDSKNK